MATALQRGFPHRADFPFQWEKEMASGVKAKTFSRVSALLLHPNSLDRLWDRATPNNWTPGFEAQEM